MSSTAPSAILALVNYCLASQGLEEATIVELEGGSANWCWRVTADIAGPKGRDRGEEYQDGIARHDEKLNKVGQASEATDDDVMSGSNSHVRAATSLMPVVSFTEGTTTTVDKPAQQQQHVDASSTYILKHAQPYIKVNPAVPFPLSRLAIEEAAMRSAAMWMNRSTTTDTSIFELNIKVPMIYDYDATHHFHCMSDGGRRTLRDAFVPLTAYHSAIGRRLGTCLALLHSRTMVTGGTTTRDMQDPIFTDNSAAVLAADFPYRNIRRAMSKLGMPEERIQVMEELVQKYGTVITAPAHESGTAGTAFICHRDCLLTNVLVADVDVDFELSNNSRTNSASGGTQNGQVQPSLTIIDWELAHLSPSGGASDVGQLAAEIAAMQRRHGNSGCLESFLLAYRDTAGTRVDERFCQQVAVHFGVQSIYWDQDVRWCIFDGGTKEGAEMGWDVAERASRREWAWMRGSVLAGLVPEGW